MAGLIDASAIWLQPGIHPVFSHYTQFFERLFCRFEVLDYRALYLEAGPTQLRRHVFTALERSSADILLYTQFPNSFGYLTPDFIASLRNKATVVGLGFDDEVYFDQTKLFYQSCSAVITSDIAGAAWLNEAGIPVYLAQLQQPHVGDPICDSTDDIAVSFVGDMTKPGRREYVRCVESSGISVADFGTGSRNGRISDTEVAEVFCRSKINLNFTATNPPRWILRHDPQRAHARQIKGRPFELAAMGRFCLCEWAPCVEHWFRPGVDIGIFRDADDLVAQVKRYLENDALRRKMSAAAKERYRAEFSFEVQFTQIFSRILSESRKPARPIPAPALGGPIFYESMGRSRGVAFLHALHRGALIRALREMFMKRSGHIEYWRGFAEAVMDTIASRLRRP